MIMPDQYKNRRMNEEMYKTKDRTCSQLVMVLNCFEPLCNESRNFATQEIIIMCACN